MKLAYVTLMLTIIGSSINSCIVQLIRFANRDEVLKDVRSLNPFKTAAALIVHFICTPVMIAQNLFTKRVMWGPSTYRCEDGRVLSVTREGDAVPSFDQSLRKYYGRPAVVDVKERLPAQAK